MTKNVELVFVPSVSFSHIMPTVQLAKLLMKRDHRLSATILVFSPPLNPTRQAHIDSLADSVPGIHFITLPPADLPPPETEPGITYLSMYIQNHKPLVNQIITQLISDSKNTGGSVRLVVDMFSTTMIDVANQLGISSYVFFTPGAAFLGLMLHLPILDSQITTEFTDYSTELTLPSYINPVPTLDLPSSLLNKKSYGYACFLSHARGLIETKGIIVNSVSELEPQPVDAINQMIHNIPRVYPVGPLLDSENKANIGSNPTHYDRIKKWLDDQPKSSVVFLCFGTRGSLGAPQVKEIADGLEKSGQRFLWSLRGPPTTKFAPPTEYTNFEEILPEGFLTRVDGRGLICGWVPQVEVLAHEATGAFLSHCGWSSILESLWFGVPILSWPLDAEQKLNAFELVKDLGLAVDVKGKEKDVVVADEVERGVRCIMEGKSEVRNKVKEMSEKCRKAVMDGGSSWSSLGCLVEDLIN